MKTTKAMMAYRAKFETMEFELARLAENGRKYSNWYDNATESINTICDSHGFNVERFAFALSALSPRAAVSRNVSLLSKLIRGLPCDGLRDTWDKASRIWNHGDHIQDMKSNAAAFTGKSGFKTSNFAVNLLGDQDAVTIDSWMCKAFGDNTLKTMSSRPAYWAASDTIRLVADMVGMTPAGCQSAIWHSYAFENGRVTMGDFSQLLLSNKWI